MRADVARRCSMAAKWKRKYELAPPRGRICAGGTTSVLVELTWQASEMISRRLIGSDNTPRRRFSSKLLELERLWILLSQSWSGAQSLLARLSKSLATSLPNWQSSLASRGSAPWPLEPPPRTCSFVPPTRMNTTSSGAYDHKAHSHSPAEPSTRWPQESQLINRLCPACAKRANWSKGERAQVICELLFCSLARPTACLPQIGFMQHRALSDTRRRFGGIWAVVLSKDKLKIWLFLSFVVRPTFEGSGGGDAKAHRQASTKLLPRLVH